MFMASICQYECIFIPRIHSYWHSYRIYFFQMKKTILHLAKCKTSTASERFAIRCKSIFVTVVFCILGNNASQAQYGQGFFGYHDIFVATHLACKAFKTDIAERGYHMYHIKGAASFNFIMAQVFEEAIDNKPPEKLDALLAGTGFNSALQACYPNDQKSKNLFIGNLHKIRQGGVTRRVAIDSAVAAIGLIPAIKLTHFLSALYASGPIILNYVEAGILMVVTAPIVQDLLEKGVKFFGSKGEEKKVIVVPPADAVANIDIQNVRQSSLDLYLESRRALKKKIASLDRPNPEWQARLESVESQIRLINPNFKD